jgi:hypothetical protein
VCCVWPQNGVTLVAVPDEDLLAQERVARPNQDPCCADFAGAYSHVCMLPVLCAV